MSAAWPLPLFRMVPAIACRPVVGPYETDGDCAGSSVCVEGTCTAITVDPPPPEDVDDPAAPPVDAGAPDDAGWLDDGRGSDGGT